MAGIVITADEWERVHDVFSLIAIDPIELEKGGVELTPQEKIPPSLLGRADEVIQ